MSDRGLQPEDACRLDRESCIADLREKREKAEWELVNKDPRVKALVDAARVGLHLIDAGDEGEQTDNPVAERLRAALKGLEEI